MIVVFCSSSSPCLLRLTRKRPAVWDTKGGNLHAQHSWWNGIVVRRHRHFGNSLSTLAISEKTPESSTNIWVVIVYKIQLDSPRSNLKYYHLDKVKQLLLELLDLIIIKWWLQNRISRKLLSLGWTETTKRSEKNPEPLQLEQVPGDHFMDSAKKLRSTGRLNSDFLLMIQEVRSGTSW